MEPLLLLAQWWWVAPTAVAGGAATWVGLRANRRLKPHRAMPRGAARRLELDAALHDLQEARDAAVRGRAEVQAAQADLLRLQADQTRAQSVVPAALAGAKRRLQVAQREVKASAADVRARRAAVKAARSTMPPAGSAREFHPLTRLMHEHDAVLVRWMAYETDPALAIAYPSMSDVRNPALSAFLQAQSQAQWLRPSAPDARTTPSAYAAYRDAVRRLRQTFDTAEQEARGRTRPSAAGTGDADGRGEAWGDVAKDIWDGASRTAEAVARAAAAWGGRRPDKRP
ncbi:hypothetical protein CVS47_00076 [Microbacterium lemovicicum]|uniref:Uncharacterized protein n=1 Tax=Microbacterium lemovicicum TaxID=1072463 RepID=A0A3S9W639_9MICO|nr:hypothetical protein [Microbacterium lemovicicum]AZS35484.1 hypothetical protein CVS47_00076 [Microbacterium lemovicicum]